MQVLLTNDDGIDSPGLLALVKVLSGEHDLLVCAPDAQRSAVSRAMTLYTPLRAEKREDFAALCRNVYAVSGTPVDCVRLGLGNLFPRPQAVLSGINLGPNLGTDTLYSGTCGAAQEGAVQGIPSIALSMDCRDGETPRHLETAARIGLSALALLQKKPLPFGAYYNINVPNLPLEKIKGLKNTRLGVVKYKDEYEKRTDTRGRDYYWACGGALKQTAERDTDERWLAEGYVTVTVLSYDCALPGQESITEEELWGGC